MRALFLALPVAALLLGLFTLASASESWNATTGTDEVGQPATDAGDPAQMLEAARPGLESPDLVNPDLADGEGGVGTSLLDDKGELSPEGGGSDLTPTAPGAANPAVVAPPGGQADPSAGEAAADTTIIDAARGTAEDSPVAEEQEAEAGSGEPNEIGRSEPGPDDQNPDDQNPDVQNPDDQSTDDLEAAADPSGLTESGAAESSTGSEEPAALAPDDAEQESATRSPAGPLSRSEPRDHDAGQGRSLSRVIGLLIAVGLALALGASAVIGLVRYLAGRRTESGDETTDAVGDGQTFMLDGPSTGRALDRLRKELETEADPRLAIRRAYAAVESGFGNDALARQSSETPGDYLGRSLARIEGAEDDLARLTELFTIARYSRHPVTEDMRLGAIESVMALRARYRLSNLVAS